MMSDKNLVLFPSNEVSGRSGNLFAESDFRFLYQRQMWIDEDL